MRKGLKRHKISGRYVAAILLMTGLCAFSKFHADISNQDITVLQAFLQYSREELTSLGEFAGAYRVAQAFRSSDWFIVFLPLLASLPRITDFAEQWLGGNYYLAISRGTRKRYALTVMRDAALSGFLCVSAGIILYYLFVYLKFPHDSMYMASAEGVALGMTSADRLWALAFPVLHTGLLAAVASMICTVLVVLIKDRFLAVSLPVLLEYISWKLSESHSFALMFQYENGAPVREHIVELFLPAAHLYYDYLFKNHFRIGYWFYLVLMGGFGLTLFLFFACLVRRRNG